METKKYSNVALESTDLNYLDKNGVSKSLGLFAIDDFWREVLLYRDDHRLSLPLRQINGRPFSLVVTPTLKGKWDRASENIKQMASSINSRLGERERREARKILFLPILKAINELSGSEMGEISLKALLNGTYGESDKAHLPTINYLSALDYYCDKSPLSVDEEFLAEAYMKISGQEELTSFYREVGAASKINFSRFGGYEQEKAPAGHIEEYMDPLFSYLSDSSTALPPFAIAAIIAFYLPYVSPVSDGNDALAAILLKGFLACRYGSDVFALPFERWLLPSKEREQALRNVRSSGDLTYFLDFLEKGIGKMATEINDSVNNARIAVFSPEYNQLSEEEKTIASQKALEQPLPPKNEQLTFDAFLEEEEKKEEIDVAEPSLAPFVMAEEPPAQKEEEAAPIKEPPEAPKKAALPPQGNITEEEMRERARHAIASAYEPDVLTEKEAKDYMRYLLETNPNLNRKQASFLSTHCTPGRFYSIQQYKAHAHCVYETARTSMDKLAIEGYYEKMQVKNKFVYTPKKRS